MSKMTNIKLSPQDRQVLGNKLKNKYIVIGGLKVQHVGVHQLEDFDYNKITTVIFYYGFLDTSTIEFIYFNDELISVTGGGVSIKFIDDMKNLFKN